MDATVEVKKNYKVSHVPGGWILREMPSGRWVCHTSNLKYMQKRCAALGVDAIIDAPPEIPAEVPAVIELDMPAPVPLPPPTVPENPTTYSERHKRYYEHHLQDIKERRKVYRESSEGKEKEAEKRKQHYLLNAEYERARCRANYWKRKAEKTAEKRKAAKTAA